MGGRRQCGIRPVPHSRPKPLTPLREQVPREPVKKSGQSPGCRDALTDLLSPLVEHSSCLPHSTNFQKPWDRRSPQRDLLQGTREGGSKAEAAEVGGAPPSPPPSSQRLGVFAVSPAGAGPPGA